MRTCVRVVDDRLHPAGPLRAGRRGRRPGCAAARARRRWPPRLGRRAADRGGLAGGRGLRRAGRDGAGGGAGALPVAGAGAARSRRGGRGVGGGAGPAGGDRRRPWRLERPGMVCFDARGLLGLYGGRVEGGASGSARAAAARAPGRALPGADRRGRVALLRGGGGRAGARRAASAREVVAGGRAGRARLPGAAGVRLLAARETHGRPARRAGAAGDRARWGSWPRCARADLADRFGRAGPAAHDLAGGEDEPLRPRQRAGAPARIAGAARGRLGPRAGARPRPAGGSAAGPPRAARAHAARGGAVRRAGRGRHLARARHLSRGAGRSGADAPGAGRAAGPAARARRDAWR